MNKISYGIRNTIVLLVVFICMAGSGWAYIEFAQNKVIGKLTSIDQKEQQKLKNDQAIANRYDQTLHKYVEANYQLTNYPKTLPANLQTYDVYSFLDKASKGNSYTDLNYTYLKTTKTKKFGIISARINGTGYYRYVYNLISTIESSYPLAKVKKLIINPYNGKDKTSLSQVAFTFELDSYFDQSGNFKEKNIIANHTGVARLYNPFYPLVHSPSPNTDDLPNVAKSTLVGVGNGLIYLVDQNGHVQKIEVGDPVYLGHLQSVNLSQKTATFYLNEGGFFNKVTLEVH